jgi:hypothetical protein
MTTDTALIQKMDDDLEVLLPCEEKQLEQCEETIEQGLGTFLDVGRALAEIRDNRLYKGSHRTFERYCKDRWDLGKAHAYRQIYGYEAVALLEQKRSPIGDKNESEDSDSVNEIHQEMILPRNEAQVRPLTKLTPEQQVEAWSLVLDWVNGGARLTSYLVGKAAKQVLAAAGQEVLERERKKTEQPSTLVSRLFQKRLQDLMEVIADEYNSGWRTTSKKEVISRLKSMILAVDELV